MQNAKAARGFFAICLAAAWAVSPQGANGQGCPGSLQQSSGPDVIVGTIAQSQGSQQISNYVSAGGIEVFSIGTTSCNLGDTTLAWIAGNNQHPVIGQNAYRLKMDPAGYLQFEQLGQSWLKHGFCALSENACCNNCQSTGCSNLGIGCSDPYTAGRNAEQSNLGPKYQVNATTGVFTYPPANPAWSGTVDRRLQVKIADLEVSNSNHTTDIADEPRYYAEAQYITQDDAAAGHKKNNVSWRPINLTGSGTIWTFGVWDTPNPPGASGGATRRMEAAIRAWEDVDPGITIKEGVTQEEGADTATVIVGSQATDLGNGMWHYEFAVQNLNSHRSFQSFNVDIQKNATVTNVGFHDVDYHSGEPYTNTDWTNSIVDTSPVTNTVRWEGETFDENSNANALRWASLYNFRFDADVPPLWTGKGTVTLDYFRPSAGDPADISVFVAGPTPCTPSDLNGDGCTNALDIAVYNDIVLGLVAPTADQVCSGDLVLPVGQVTLAEADAFVAGLIDATGTSCAP